MKLTNDQRRRVYEAIDETEKHLNRELSYSEQFQKKDMVNFYRNHLEKLNNMLANDQKAVH